MSIELDRIGWEDEPSTKTPIDSGNLKKLEENIQKALSELETLVTGKVLYDNIVGTKENVTLSEGAENFKRIKVIGYGINTNTTYFECELEEANQKNLGISFNVYNGGSFSYLLIETIKFNSKTIERGSQWQLGLGGSLTRKTGEIFITKVIGYNN